MLAFLYLLNFENKLDTVVNLLNLNAMHHYKFKIVKQFLKLATILN